MHPYYYEFNVLYKLYPFHYLRNEEFRKAVMKATILRMTVDQGSCKLIIN
jgi:hypothetical protein